MRYTNRRMPIMYTFARCTVCERVACMLILITNADVGSRRDRRGRVFTSLCLYIRS